MERAPRATLGGENRLLSGQEQLRREGLLGRLGALERGLQTRPADQIKVVGVLWEANTLEKFKQHSSRFAHARGARLKLLDQLVALLDLLAGGAATSTKQIAEVASDALKLVTLYRGHNPAEKAKSPRLPAVNSLERKLRRLWLQAHAGISVDDRGQRVSDDAVPPSSYWSGLPVEQWVTRHAGMGATATTRVQYASGDPLAQWEVAWFDWALVLLNGSRVSRNMRLPDPAGVAAAPVVAQNAQLTELLRMIMAGEGVGVRLFPENGTAATGSGEALDRIAAGVDRGLTAAETGWSILDCLKFLGLG
jgi:hypothetical protein